MKRETRYTVLKNKDVSEALTHCEKKWLECICASVEAHRAKQGKQPFECVVVESDWPEYEPTWKAIEARVTKNDVQKLTHPESVCEKCGRPNITWFTNSELWNKYARKHDIICPICFIELAEAAGCVPPSWEILPEKASTDAVCPECGDDIDSTDGILGCANCGTTVDTTLPENVMGFEEKYLKFFNLHHTLAVQEAGIKGILCDALEIEHYQHSLYELAQMVTSKLEPYVAAGVDETAWLVEISTKEGAKWLCPKRNFTDDPNDVIRFSRKCDAEAIISILGLTDLDAFATDHMWMSV